MIPSERHNKINDRAPTVFDLPAPIKSIVDSFSAAILSRSICSSSSKKSSIFLYVSDSSKGKKQREPAHLMFSLLSSFENEIVLKSFPGRAKLQINNAICSSWLAAAFDGSSVSIDGALTQIAVFAGTRPCCVCLAWNEGLFHPSDNPPVMASNTRLGSLCSLGHQHISA
jgi:hypothetical protein